MLHEQEEQVQAQAIRPKFLAVRVLLRDRCVLCVCAQVFGFGPDETAYFRLVLFKVPVLDAVVRRNSRTPQPSACLIQLISGHAESSPVLGLAACDAALRAAAVLVLLCLVTV